MSERKPILCVDWDGVVHAYTSGWIAADVIPDGPVEGALEFLGEAVKHFDVYIYSARSHQDGGIDAMKDALRQWSMDKIMTEQGAATSEAAAMVHDFVYATIKWPTFKPSAMVTIDDRVLRFEGPMHWPAMHELLAFKPWNKE